MYHKDNNQQSAEKSSSQGGLIQSIVGMIYSEPPREEQKEKLVSPQRRYLEDLMHEGS